MQLKIEGRNKLGQLKMVLLHADAITDGEVRNALQIVGFPLNTRHDPMDGHDVLRDIGEKEKHGKYITHADLDFEKTQRFAAGHKEGYDEGYAHGVKVGKAARLCRRRHVTDDDLKLARQRGYNEGWDAHRAHAEQQTAAVPAGLNVISDAELADRINQAYSRGVNDGKGEAPSTFPIPADVWNGKHYGEFITIKGFAPDTIPGASEHGYETLCMYMPRNHQVDNPFKSALINAGEMTQDMLDSGDYIAVLVTLLR